MNLRVPPPRLAGFTQATIRCGGVWVKGERGVHLKKFQLLVVYEVYLDQLVDLWTAGVILYPLQREWIHRWVGS